MYNRRSVLSTIYDVPLMHRGPTVHLRKTCTGALPLAGPGSLRSHYGFGEKKRKRIYAILELITDIILFNRESKNDIYSTLNTKQISYLLFSGIFVLQLLKEPAM